MKVDNETLYYEYEQILIGNKDAFTPCFFKYGDKTSHTYAMIVLRFAVEKYLRWNPYDMKDLISKEIIDLMKLNSIMKYINFPIEVNKDEDYYILAALAYPNIIKIDTKELVLRTYKDVLNDKISKFPKEYLTGFDGIMRAGICLQHIIKKHYGFSSNQELYAFFISPDCIKALKKYRLNNISNEMFEYPIDFLHESLPSYQKDEFLYNFYKFLYIYNNLDKKKKTNKSKKRE